MQCQLSTLLLYLCYRDAAPVLYTMCTQECCPVPSSFLHVSSLRSGVSCARVTLPGVISRTTRLKALPNQS